METRSFSAGEIVLFTVFLVVVIIFGIVGNTFVIVATLKFTRLRRNISNFLLFNLAVADLLSSSVIMPYHLATVINLDIVRFNGLVCQIGGTITYPVLITSTLTLVMLAVDRYVAMADPLRYKARIITKTIWFMIAYTWLHALVFTIFTMTLVEVEFDNVSLDCGVSWERSPLWFGALSMILNIVGPFLFLSFTSLKVLAIARKHHKKIMSDLLASQGTSANLKSRESKATSIILTVILVFLVTWSPYLVTRALRVFGITLPSVVYTWSVWILHTNAVANFFIYARRGHDYRQAFLAIIRGQSILRDTEQTPACVW